MTQRDDDLQLLNELLKEHPDELSNVETEAFAGMRFDLTAGFQGSKYQELTEKQRSWAIGVRERIVPQYANLFSRGLVPRGREVPTPPVLRVLPKKPPPMPRPIAGPVRTSRKHCGREDEGCYAFVNGDCTCGCCS
jgi:hypothetical protein